MQRPVEQGNASPAGQASMQIGSPVVMKAQSSSPSSVAQCATPSTCAPSESAGTLAETPESLEPVVDLTSLTDSEADSDIPEPLKSPEFDQDGLGSPGRGPPGSPCSGDAHSDDSREFSIMAKRRLAKVNGFCPQELTSSGWPNHQFEW
eukprot:980723-Alexandrium_andersonii.AAC.1